MGSCMTSAPAARSCSKVASQLSVAKISPGSRPLATSPATASRSAGDMSGYCSGTPRTISTPGWAGGLSETQRNPSKETSLMTFMPSTSR